MTKIPGSTLTLTTLSMVKQTGHVSRLAYLEIRRISSIRHLLTTKATVQHMCMFFSGQSVGLLQLFAHCHQLTVIRCTGCKRFKTMQVVFRKSRYEHVTPLLKALHWLLVKDRIIFKDTNFVFRFFNGTPRLYLSLCFSVYTPSRTFHSSSDFFLNKKCAR